MAIPHPATRVHLLTLTALCPALVSGEGDTGAAQKGNSYTLEIDWRGWRVLVCRVAALHQAQQGWTAHLGGGATAQLNATLSRCTVAAFDFSGQPFTARTLVALIRFHLVLQLAGRIQMVGLVDATIQQIDTSLCGPLLDISGGSNVGGVQLQLP